MDKFPSRKVIVACGIPSLCVVIVRAFGAVFSFSVVRVAVPPTVGLLQSASTHIDTAQPDQKHKVLWAGCNGLCMRCCIICDLRMMSSRRSKDHVNVFTSKFKSTQEMDCVEI